MRLKKFMSVLAFAVFCKPVFGISAYWIGGESGDWHTSSNWSGNVVPNTANYLVFVTNETPVKITLNSGTTLCHISFSGADHVISGSGTMIFRQGNGLRQSGVEVAEGVTATIREAYPHSHLSNGFLKTGKGRMIASSYFGQASKSFTEFEIREGEFYCEYGQANSVNAEHITVRSGAVLKAGRWGIISDSTIIHLEKGAVYDGGGTFDAVGGFTGEGIVTNLNKTTVNTFTAGPLDFAGRIFTGRGLNLSFRKNRTQDGINGYLRVGAADTLAAADVYLGGTVDSQGRDQDEGITNILRFAAGIGEFDCKSLYFYKPIPVVLEDSAGEPVYLRTKLEDDTYNAYFTGKGGLIKVGSKEYRITNGTYSARGTLKIEEGSVCAGNGQEGFDASALHLMTGLNVGSGAVFNMQNFADVQWPQTLPVTGRGTVKATGRGNWTIGNLSLTNGWLEVAYPASKITLAGGVSTNLNYTIGPDTFETVITGGEHYFEGSINFERKRTFTQSGGTVFAVPQANHSSSNEFFYTMTGGRLISLARRSDIRPYWPNGIYPQGIGLDLSGTAHAELRNTESFYHRLASGNASHTIRLRDDAYLYVDYLQFGEAAADAVATLDLSGGTVEVAKTLTFPSGITSDSKLKVNILFNGGKLRSLPQSGNSTWAHYDPAQSLISGKVQAGGAYFDIRNNRVTLTFPLVSDTLEGVMDGGLVKVGPGELELKKCCDIKGPIRILEGRYLSNDKTSSLNPAGSGDILLGGGDLSLLNGRAVSVCSDVGSAFTYTNCASLSLSSGMTLTIGPGNADKDGAVVRGGHGVLAISPNTTDKKIGVAASVVINGGLSADEKTKLPLQPVYAYNLVSQPVGKTGYSTRRLGFLTCDEEGRLLPASTVAFDPATSTASTVAEIRNSTVAVSEDATVGALNVEYKEGCSSSVGATLSIADGKKLSIGSGTQGAVAPLLLNNAKTGDNGYQVVSGGTIYFGAAEGVVVVNEAGRSEKPSQINSVIAGSGGMTFAAPALTVPGFRGCLQLGAANTYSGGTWVEGVQLQILNVAGLGSGEVNVEGYGIDGGSVFFKCTGTVANRFRLSGYGPKFPNTNATTPRFGTLTTYKNLKLTGGVEVLGTGASLMAGCNSGYTTLDVASVISGEGELTVYGLGTVKFSAANSYAGGTVVVDGVLEVTDSGSLGTGPVEVKEGATLRFTNTSAKTIDNVIIGDGRIECAGAAVTFGDISGFDGDFSGGGAFSGEDYVKTGAGTLSLTTAAKHTGNTRVKEGTLVLGEGAYGEYPAQESIMFRLDASQEDSLTLQDNRVTEWRDADGRDFAFTNAVDKAPEFVANSQGDMPSVFFDGTHQRRVVAKSTVEGLASVFIVNRVKNEDHPKLGSSHLNAGIFGATGVDSGLRMGSKTKFKNDSMFVDGLVYGNGVLGGSVNAGAFGLLQADAAIEVPSVRFSIGDYWGSTLYIRSYYGDIAEVVAYDRHLTENERKTIERLLFAKWGIKDVTVPVYTNLLPVATALTVDAGATVDLAGGSHEIASLSGSGTVINSSGHRAVLRLNSGTSAFSGILDGNVYLEVGADAVLDLGGGTIRVAAVGGSGAIVNGTVIVTDRILPGGENAVGTLSFGKAPVVEGATLEIEANAKDGADAITVGEHFDMTGLRLYVPSRRGFFGHDFEIVSVDGALTGEFSAHNLPATTHWRIDYKTSSAHIVHHRGLTITVR